MEKYAIDIDKVLDEFEETEALKIGAAPHLTEYLRNDEEATNIWPSTSSVVEGNDSTFLDKKMFLAANLNKLDENTKLSDIQNTLGNLPFANNGEMQCADEANLKKISFNIFYKPCESIPIFNENKSDKSEPLDCITDEILCVSVLENSDSPTTALNSNAIVTNSHSSVNDESKNFTSYEGLDAFNHLDTSCLIVKNDASDTLIKESNFELNNENGIQLNCSNSSQGILRVCKSEQALQNEIKHQDYITDGSSQVCKENLALQSHPKSMNKDFAEISDLLPCEAKQSCLPALVNNCSNQNANSNVEAFSVNSHFQDDNNAAGSNKSGVHDIIDQNELNYDNIQDNDSGVSSTEDISGNSPPEINKRISTMNENCDINTNSTDVEAPLRDACKFTTSADELVMCNSNVMSELGNGIEEHIVDNKVSSLVSSVDQDILYDKNCRDICNNGYFSNDVNRDIYTTEMVASALNENLQGIEQNKEELQVILNTPLADENSCSLEKFGTSLSENFTQSCPEDLVEKVLENTCSSLSIYHEKDQEFDKFVKEQTNLDQNEAVNFSDDSTFPETVNLLKRHQRPTTLDLPPTLISSAGSSVEPQCQSENNKEHLIDISTEVGVTDEQDAENTPCANQQKKVGFMKPYWIPDADAINCMHCGMKFTVLKRRHHCRGCGKVLCSRCCNQKAYLAYLKKEDRICQVCAGALSSTLQNDISVSLDAQSPASSLSSPNFTPTSMMSPSNCTDKSVWKPHPNNPDDYCSVIPPLQQIQITGPRPPPTVMVPTGVLKRGNKQRKEPKQVIFSDGIRPGGDLTDLTEAIENVPVYRRIGRKRVDRIISAQPHMEMDPNPSPESYIQRSFLKRVIISDNEGNLPPIMLQTDSQNDVAVDWNSIFKKMQDSNQFAINFALMKNLHLFGKLVNLDCCFGNECWCFTSNGLCTLGQDEVMVVMEKLPGETTIPRDIFKLFRNVHDSASKGSTFDDLSYIFFSEQLLGSNDHRGFLFVRPTFQCLSKLIVPNTPYLVAILIHKWEVPWAKIFPLRLMLRLGAECRYYPCSLVSIRYRKPVYYEIGQTIMSVLADLRNFQFTLPLIPGLVVHMEEKKTFVNIPRNRYEKLIKVLNSNNVEHVLALGANFSTEADSHLVCMQNEEGDYQTQAINIENTTRKVTGASFIVFSGALKSTSGLTAKFSIVEDGLLVQIPQDTMTELHMALRDMRDISIYCGQINSHPEETVIIQWARDDKKFNIGVRSPIDGKSLEGIPNVRIHTSTDYAGENYLIRWTEAFFFDVDQGDSFQNDAVDPCQFAETVAQSCCMTLAPYLDQLAEEELIKLGLRVTLDSLQDRVEYEIGARGKVLPRLYTNSLDSALIPVILRLSNSTHNEKLSFELIFHVMVK